MSIEILTLTFSIIAAIAAVISIIPVMKKWLFHPKFSIELEYVDQIMEVTVYNIGSGYFDGSLAVVLTFGKDAEVKILPYARNKGGISLGGMLYGSRFKTLNSHAVQANINSPVGPKSALYIDSLKVIWELDAKQHVSWSIFRDGIPKNSGEITLSS